MAETEKSRMLTHSNDLLDVGKTTSSLSDTLLVTRTKPTRLPPSSVLSKVKNFLPKLQEANQSLEERLASEDVDIENIDGCDGPVIEMNIAIQEHDDETDDSSSSEEDSSDDDVADDIGLLDEVTTDNIKMPRRTDASNKGKRPLIEECRTGQDSEAVEVKTTEDR